MLDLEVLEDPQRAALTLDPIKRRLLAELATPSSAASVAARLGLTLDLTGANVGERRTTPSQPQTLSGILEHILQTTKQRWILMRLDAPAPAIALIGTYGTGTQVNASMTIFFYGDTANDQSAASQRMWQTWMTEFHQPA